MTARAELSSCATALDELAGRITLITDGLTPAERDGLGAELYEVERTLSAARRRLERIVDSPA